MTDVPAWAGPTEGHILYGDAAPREDPVELSAGPLTAELRGIELAEVRVGDREIVRRIYMSVRDENWDTLVPEISELKVERSAGSFVVTFAAHTREGSIDFRWTGRIEGSANGTLRYAMDGEIGAACRYCRIGFCLLHGPEEYAGRAYRAGIDSTDASSGTFPVAIAPQLLRDGIYLPVSPTFKRLDVELDGGLRVRYDLEGELFEIEDQRNWTDASFKTYSTPSCLGFPFDAAAGQRFSQSVSVSTSGAAVPACRAPAAAIVDVEIGEPFAHPFPAVGTAFVEPPPAPSSWMRDILNAVGLQHLRVDVHLDDPRAAAVLAAASDVALSAGAELELALFATEDMAASAGPLLRRLREGGAGLARILAFDARNEVTSPGVIDSLRRVLRTEQITSPLAGGTDVWFAEINREPPELSGLDALTFSITPEVHAFDDLSLVETLPVQAEVVRAAHALSGGLPIVVSTVTLRPRNSAITVDARQRSLFGAAWTLGSLKYLAEAGASSVTVYETTGPRGLFEPGGDHAHRLPVPPGMVFPLYHVVATACSRLHTRIHRAVSSDPSRIEALVTRDDRTTQITVANLRNAVQQVRVAPLLGTLARVRMLDSRSAVRAMTAPAAFTAEQGAEFQLSHGILALELAPHAVAFVDLADTPGA